MRFQFGVFLNKFCPNHLKSGNLKGINGVNGVKGINGPLKGINGPRPSHRKATWERSRIIIHKPLDKLKSFRIFAFEFATKGKRVS